jgi:hypothetical protein
VIVLKATMTGDLLFGKRAQQVAERQLTVTRRNVGRRSKVALQAMIPKRTGETRGAVYFRSRGTPEGFSVDVGVAQRRIDVFRWLVTGTEEHVIPGNPLLSFFWENGPLGPGQYVYPQVTQSFESKIDMADFEKQAERISAEEAFLYGVRFEREVG